MSAKALGNCDYDLLIKLLNNNIIMIRVPMGSVEANVCIVFLGVWAANSFGLFKTKLRQADLNLPFKVILLICEAAFVYLSHCL